jgi:alkanesulfonate monooxygenase SsuD/methylene tetrahydromethanopterin reductase-like flavin-dependent oxidoreductase (luciferase family)
MQFGITVDTHVSKWDLVCYAEELGYDRAWVPDSQMIWSDCYATLALAAVNTRRIQIGTGVSIPGTRIAPVTAHSIASINQLAPGRVFLGIGTGHTAMRVMGQDPMPAGEFREYLRVVRALLDGEAVEYAYRGKTREIKFLHRDRFYINLDKRIPIYVAANGPIACEATGAYGDGWITVGRDAHQVASRLEHIKSGATAAKRKIGQDFHTALLTAGCVLRPGEKLTSERVINETGSWVTCELHFFYEIWKKHGQKNELVPQHFANLWEEYLERVKSYSLPENARFRQIHDGHCTFMQPEERRFVTPDAIRASCIVGTPDEVVAQLREMERNGLNEINLLPAADWQRSVWRDFAELVMPSFR